MTGAANEMTIDIETGDSTICWRSPAVSCSPADLNSLAFLAALLHLVKVSARHAFNHRDVRRPDRRDEDSMPPPPDRKRSRSRDAKAEDDRCNISGCSNVCNSGF